MGGNDNNIAGKSNFLKRKHRTFLDTDPLDLKNNIIHTVSDILLKNKLVIPLFWKNNLTVTLFPNYLKPSLVFLCYDFNIYSTDTSIFALS